MAKAIFTHFLIDYIQFGINHNIEQLVQLIIVQQYCGFTDQSFVITDIFHPTKYIGQLISRDHAVHSVINLTIQKMYFIY